jgi:hypothetical protein
MLRFSFARMPPADTKRIYFLQMIGRFVAAIVVEECRAG